MKAILILTLAVFVSGQAAAGSALAFLAVDANQNVRRAHVALTFTSDPVSY